RELEPAQRAAFLAARCSGDAEARRKIEELLYSDDSGPGPLDEPAIKKLPPNFWSAPTVPSINGSQREPRLSPGQSLGSRYRVVSGPMEGAMGQVYLARDTELKRDIALKVLPAQFAQNADWVLRFRREAQVLASLKHPNICEVHHLGHDDGIDYIDMEFVE